MEQNNKTPQPNHTAVRTALWRALHVQVDPVPHIFEDEIGIQLVAPDEGWQQRPDMDKEFTKRVRVSMAARARFVEDLVVEQCKNGVDQYVILGSGLDTFAQRRLEIASKINIFEIDQPEMQIWKRQRLIELGFGVPNWLRFVPVDFEKDSSWLEKLKEFGFDVNKPAVIACTGVFMYLTREAILETLREVKTFAPESVLAATFLLPIELIDEEDKELMQISMNGAQRSGTPFKSLFSPSEILELAKEAGCVDAKVVSKNDLVKLYFSDRKDKLSPASGEEFLVVTT